MKKEDVEKHVNSAVKWAATEHYYFKELFDDLNKLKAALAVGKENEAVRDIKEALGDFRYISRAETRLQSQEQHVEQFIEKLLDHEAKIDGKISVRTMQHLLQRLHEEAAQLIADSSRYEGKIKELLTHLHDEIKDHEFEQAQQVLQQVEELITDAEKWLAALLIDIKRAKKIIVDSNFDKEIKREDLGLEDFSNPQTRAAIKALAINYGVTVGSVNEQGFSASFGKHGATISLNVRNGRFGITCTRLESNSSFHRNINAGYSILKRYSYPSFKAYFIRFLEVLQEAVEMRSRKDIHKRLLEEKL
ncbi:hypothetical protein HOI26_04540 [Candidatus Woesearchaeota archaeon]|jgi:hypothetical protein|nr:hypothetical protein [Candidatus Woesearchaeota archaeon]MBT5740337.1 hypothetical protein [Candidatus Woesearchaeota archaeon]